MKKLDTVCIIDDDPIFVFATKRIMQFSNFCNGFLDFNNGQEAINYLRPLMERNENIPELILLDLNMPVLDGWQFLDEFVKIKYDGKVTIYIVSSSIMASDFAKAEKYEQVCNYIIKPVTPETLKSIVENFAGEQGE
jgi:CheY-like chemotaxis protein